MARKKKAKREAQDKYGLDVINFNHKPLDITKFGSDEDPCFGTMYDLNVAECKVCGDAEFCAIKFNRELSGTRKKLEKKNKYKDITTSQVDEGDKLDKATIKKVKRFMNRKIEKGSKPIKIRKLAMDKYGITKDEAKLIYNQLK